MLVTRLLARPPLCLLMPKTYASPAQVFFLLRSKERHARLGFVPSRNQHQILVVRWLEGVFFWRKQGWFTHSTPFLCCRYNKFDFFLFFFTHEAFFDSPSLSLTFRRFFLCFFINNVRSCFFSGIFFFIGGQKTVIPRSARRRCFE